MILSVTPNPCVDKTIFLDTLEVGTKNHAYECTCIAGGKGVNVSRAVEVLGYKAVAMALVGGAPGNHVLDLIEEQDGMSTIPIWIEDDTRTITTVLEEFVHRQTPFFEPGPRVSKAEHDQFLITFSDVAAQARVITLNGTVPDPSLERLYAEFIALAKEVAVPTILDSHGPEFRYGVEGGPDMVKPNLVEAEELLGMSLPSYESRCEAIARIHDMGVPLVVLSLGKDGVLASDGVQRLRVTPPDIEAVNPVGSGDALVAAFAIGFEEGWSLEDMATLGVAAGTANALSWEIGHFTRNDLDALSGQVKIDSW